MPTHRREPTRETRSLSSAARPRLERRRAGHDALATDRRLARLDGRLGLHRALRAARRSRDAPVPRSSSRTISGVFDDLIRVAERHGGDVLKFRGRRAPAPLRRRPSRRAGLRRRRGHAACDRSRRRGARRRSGRSSSGWRVACTRALSRRSSPRFRTASCWSPVAPRPGCSSSRISRERGRGGSQRGDGGARSIPSWLAGSRDGAHLLRALEPGSSPIPPPEAVARPRARPLRPEPLRDHLAVASGDAEHRQVTVAFVKASGTDAADDDLGADRRADRRAGGRDGRRLRTLRAHLARVRHRRRRSEALPDGRALRRRRVMDEEAMVRGLRDIVGADVGLSLRAGVNRGRVFTGTSARKLGAPTR